MMRQLINIFLLLLSLSASSQNLAGDLSGAKTIVVNKLYSQPSSPKGFGNLQEFPKDEKRSPYIFKEERNTIWYIIEIPFSGMLTFEIKPHRKEDDYDWMLFNIAPKLGLQLSSGDALPIRSNNSRNDLSIKGATGIKSGLANNFEAPGPGKSFSSALMVKSGQKLALIIDNIYDKGAGFDFIAELKPPVSSFTTLSGYVKDQKTNLPLQSNIVCEDDSSGYKFGETTAGPNGLYKLQIPASRPVNVSATYPGYIFQTADIEPQSTDIEHNFNLDKPAATEKLRLYNIHFLPDRDLINPSSEPELNRLIELLKLQKEYEIRLIGHTNNNPFADARYLQKLSFNRALAVKQYLISKGIVEKRISCTGVGGKQPLIVTQDVEEGLKNLRVEVVLSKQK